ncbi:hypothetical protein DES39_2170 [Orbus hercynius]|uniref:DUF4123 domain-containing protein n=1 Tax=Orbus hercynius TaxID=593135 RepID=A0A495RAS2_9GAMM|nr:hypothetical protein [Orbus hercynius]RKS84431.1 hypothetical protein DES39_2170 [Orbus hercynius]
MISQLNEIFNQVQNRSYYRYLLIDGLASVSEFSSISLPALRNHFPEHAIIPIKRSDLSHDLAHCPHLICLAEPEASVDPHYIYRSAKEALSEYQLPRRYIVGWLMSKYPPEEITKLIEQVGGEISARQGGLFTPFYEPFRLSLLNVDNTFSTFWLSAMLSGISHFFYINVEGQLANAIVGESLVDKTFVYLPESALFYQREAKALFYLYDSYQTLQTDDNTPLAKNALALLCQYYQQAVNLGINHLADRYVFAFYAMRYGDLGNYAKAMDAVNRALHNSGTLGDNLMNIEDEDWRKNDR